MPVSSSPWRSPTFCSQPHRRRSGRIGVLTDGRLRPITLGNLNLDFQGAAPSRRYWARRPATRSVQAPHWLRDMLPSDDGSLRKRLVCILKGADHGQAIRDGLRSGLSALAECIANDRARPPPGGER